MFELFWDQGACVLMFLVMCVKIEKICGDDDVPPLKLAVKMFTLNLGVEYKGCWWDYASITMFKKWFCNLCVYKKKKH